MSCSWGCHQPVSGRATEDGSCSRHLCSLSGESIFPRVSSLKMMLAIEVAIGFSTRLKAKPLFGDPIWPERWPDGWSLSGVWKWSQRPLPWIGENRAGGGESIWQYGVNIPASSLTSIVIKMVMFRTTTFKNYWENIGILSALFNNWTIFYRFPVPKVRDVILFLELSKQMWAYCVQLKKWGNLNYLPFARSHPEQSNNQGCCSVFFFQIPWNF